jgi:hypothetical protein
MQNALLHFFNHPDKCPKGNRGPSGPLKRPVRLLPASQKLWPKHHYYQPASHRAGGESSPEFHHASGAPRLVSSQPIVLRRHSNLALVDDLLLRGSLRPKDRHKPPSGSFGGSALRWPVEPNLFSLYAILE